MQRRAIATAARARLLAAGVALSLTVPAMARGGAPAVRACASGVSLRGDRRDVQELARSLARYDGGGSAPGACRHWDVTVVRAGPHITVQLANEEGTTVERRVGDMQVAAAVVDSWLHEPPMMSPTVAPAAAAQVAARPEDVARASRRRDPLSLTLGSDLALGSEGSRWLGGHVGACVAVGRFCAGALAQVAISNVTVGDPGTTRRTTGAVLASLDLPLELGRVRLVPGVGLGATFVREKTSDAPPANPLELTGARTNTDWDVLGSARLVLAIPLAGRVGVDVGAAFDLSLPARSAATDGQGGTYPADPLFLLRGGVALRYGLP